MGKIRLFFQNLSLRKSIIVYITVFAFVGVLLSAFTASSCNILKTRIRASYPISTEKYYLTTERGEQLGDGAYIGTDFPDEFSHSIDTKNIKGANEKAKANAIFAIDKLIKIANNKREYPENLFQYKQPQMFQVFHSIFLCVLLIYFLFDSNQFFFLT